MQSKSPFKLKKKIKLVSLISGGIDSPVATHLMLEKGAKIVCVHMDNRPFIDEKPVDKVKQIVRHLAKLHKQDIKLYIVSHGENQSQFVSSCDRALTCVLCRRMMYRIAEKIAEAEKADGILTGENLGQVASQTLDNIFSENACIKTKVIRPLIGFDKEETINIARKIGTYDISILPGQCCGLTPVFPETHSRLSHVENEEKNVDIEGLLEASVKNAKVINISA